MFSFGRDARYRLESHRHNPYIGSFHTVDRRTKPSSSSMLLDSSLKNPFIGTIRHSPAGSSAGLKGILWEEEPWKAPVTSQLKLSREKKYSNRHASMTLLASIPVTRFKHTDAALPLCGICLDTFKDGDELRPLPCSHCFHRACVDEWLLGFKSDERTFTNNCPCCRQDISPGCSTHLNMFPTSCTIPLIDEDTLSCNSSSSPPDGCAIPRQSFERLGRYLSASDIGTSKTLSERFIDEEDSECMSDLDEEENNEVSSYIAGRELCEERPFLCEECGEDLQRNNESCAFRVRHAATLNVSLSADSQDDSCFYDVSLSDAASEDRESRILMINEDRGDNGDIQLSTLDRKNVTECFQVYGSVIDDESLGSEQEKLSCDITLGSHFSNVSICTATNKFDGSSEKKKINMKHILGDAEEDSLSDMEELSSFSTSFPSDDLLGSLYSDCGVPLRSLSPSTAPRKLSK